MKAEDVLIGFVMFLFVLLLAGCAHGLVGELPKVDPHDAATIVFVRPWSFTGSAVNLAISVDGRDIYALGPAEHVIFAVVPGERLIGVTNRQTQVLQAERGRTYYYQIISDLRGLVFNRIPPHDGRELMADTKPLAP